MEDIKKQIELLSKKQEEILTIGIKKEVQKIFKQHKNLIEYTDCMGVQFFTDKNGDNIDFVYNNFKYLEKLEELYDILPNFSIGETIVPTI